MVSWYAGKNSSYKAFHMRTALCTLALATWLTAGPGLVAAQTKSSENPPVDQVGGKKLEEWMTELKSGDPSVRLAALQAIPAFGSTARKAGSAIIANLAHGDASVRANAAIALGLIPLDDKDVSKAVAALESRLQNERQAVCRFHVTLAVAQFGTDAKDCIPRLLNVAQDPESCEIRKAGVHALARVAAAEGNNPPDARAFPVLIGRLNPEPRYGEPSVLVRLEAAIALSMLGPPASPTDLKKVQDALLARIVSKTEDDSVRIWSSMALMSVNNNVNEKELAAIGEFLKSTKLTTRMQAARALGEVGAKAKPQVPALVKMLTDSEPMAVLAACWALSEIGDTSQQVVQGLTTVAEKHKDDNVKKIGKEALARIKGAKPK